MHQINSFISSFILPVLLSPTGVSDRFTTPRRETVKRSLFDNRPQTGGKLMKKENADHTSTYRIETPQKTILVLKERGADLDSADYVTCRKTVQHGKEVSGRKITGSFSNKNVLMIKLISDIPAYAREIMFCHGGVCTLHDFC